MVKVASELQLGWSLEDREDTLAISGIRRHGEFITFCEILRRNSLSIIQV